MNMKMHKLVGALYSNWNIHLSNCVIPRKENLQSLVIVNSSFRLWRSVNVTVHKVLYFLQRLIVYICLSMCV